MTASPEPASITVGGTGRVAVQPDIADLRLGVAIARDTVADARSEAARVMAAILAAIRTAGVTDRDIRTTLLSVQPRYDYREGKAPRLVGYDLSNVVEVTVRDLATVGDVIDGALRSGATSLDGLAFRVDDPSAAEREARIAAVASARARADILAEARRRDHHRRRLDRRGRRRTRSAGLQGPADVLAADAGTPVEAGTTDRGHRQRDLPDRCRLSAAAYGTGSISPLVDVEQLDVPSASAVIELMARPLPEQDGRLERVECRVDRPQRCPSIHRRTSSARRSGARPGRGRRHRRSPRTRAVPVLRDGQGQPGLVALGRRLVAVGALHRVPAVVEAAHPVARNVDLLPRPLADVADPQVAGRRGRSASATGCAARSARSRAARPRPVSERVVGGDRVGRRLPGGHVDVDAEDLGQVRLEAAAVAVRIATGAAVAERDVQHPVRTEREAAAVVVGERLLDLEMIRSLSGSAASGSSDASKDETTVSPSRSV